MKVICILKASKVDKQVPDYCIPIVGEEYRTTSEYANHAGRFFTLKEFSKCFGYHESLFSELDSEIDETELFKERFKELVKE